MTFESSKRLKTLSDSRQVLHTAGSKRSRRAFNSPRHKCAYLTEKEKVEVLLHFDAGLPWGVPVRLTG